MGDWLEAEQRAERAQQLCESRRFEEALSELDAALSINPNDATWHAQRGVLLEELDRCSEAVDAYQQALDLEPDDAEVGLALGGTLIRLGRLAQALEIVDDLAKQHPDLEPVYCARVQIYAELGQHEKSEEMFYLAQQLDDSCPDCFYHVGVSLAARGQTGRAIYCWQQVLELEPDYAGVNQRISQAYRARGDFELAKEYLLREVRADPGDTDLFYELAEVALEAGHTAAAAARFAQIIELDPNNVEAHAALGKLRLEMGTPADAILCFEAALSAVKGKPKIQDFDLNFGLALFRVGRLSEARKRLLIAARRKPHHARVEMLLGECFLAANQPDIAIEWYRRVLARDTRNPFVQHKLGVCHIQCGRYGVGLDYCLEAIRIQPDLDMAAYHAAVAYIQLCKWRAARAMVRRGLRRHSGYQPLEELRGRIWRFQFSHYLGRLLGPFGVRFRRLGVELLKMPTGDKLP